MVNFIKKLFSPANNYKIQSFTFFIPSPPPRTNGYREKQFDKIFYNFINRGYEIISLQTQNSTGTNQSGMWVICVVRALNRAADVLDLNDLSTKLSNESIDGLYYLDNEENEQI